LYSYFRGGFRYWPD